ncbi:MAG: divergent polysaccharide deacetylase family protein [Spirochaetes bacterium]|nr:divergent polysaccharide deacetylase family protein [Spirochaetota bacterium]
MRSARIKKFKNKKKRAGWPWAVAAVLALIAALAAIAIDSERRASPPASPADQVPSTTTEWPYGQPEYVVEIPKGYEDLLPAKPGPAADGDQKDRQVETPAPARPSKTFIATAVKTEGKFSPTLIIVIDDVGYNLGQLKPFLDLPFPLTVAVLPGIDHSAESARLAADAGKEVILHQPMEALGGQNPGPGTITLGMDGKEAATVLASNLDSLPQAKGVNNHMGSAVTREKSLMSAILDLVKERGIYYLDSLTAPGTATAGLCAELSIPFWERDVFLDNSGDRQSILHSLDEGKKLASSRGASVLIGHVWSSELAQTLMDIYPRLIEEGYSLSTISKFMLRSAAEDGDARPGN